MKYYKANSGEEIKKEDYSKVVIFKTSDLPPSGHLLQMATIYPQTKQRLHYHDTQSAVIYILEGEGSAFINDREFLLQPGDALLCEPGDRQYFWNKTGKNFTFLVFKMNVPEVDDTHWES